jgi:putative peptidoglycan lipid II flippase
MWAPIANNLVVIAVFSGVLIFQNSITLETITDSQIQLLGWGTTLGIVVQALILIPVVKRSGIHLRIRFGLHGLGKSFSLAGWTLVYVLISQLGYLVTVNVATSAAVRSSQEGITQGWDSHHLPLLITLCCCLTQLSLSQLSQHFYLIYLN